MCQAAPSQGDAPSHATPGVEGWGRTLQGQAERAGTPPNGAEAREVKERIREVALKLFAERGFHAVSVRDICRDAGTTLPMVYYYYGNKRGLYDALLEEAIDRRVRRLQAARQHQGSIVDRLRVVLETWASPEDADLPWQVQMFYVRELTGLGAGINTESLERLDRELRHAVRPILEDGIAEGLFRPVNVPMVTLAMIGIVNTFRRRMVVGAKVTLEDGLEQVTDTLLHGLLRHEPRSPEPAPEAPPGEPPAGLSWGA